MTRDELVSVVKGNTHHSVHFNAIMAAVDAYSSASNGAKPLVSGSLPCDAIITKQALEVFDDSETVHNIEKHDAFVKGAIWARGVINGNDCLTT